MADYVVLLNIAPTVLDGIVFRATAAPENLSTLVALSSLRGFVNTLLHRPTRDADGEEAVCSRPNVSELQSLERTLMSDIGALATHSGKWDRPFVHRLLELLYRTLPIVQLSSALCEHLFEKFHQHSKRELLLSNDKDPAAFSMLRWREVDVLAKFVRDAAANGVPAEWLNNRDGSHLKMVQHHMKGARSVPPRPADSGWVVRKKSGCKVCRLLVPTDTREARGFRAVLVDDALWWPSQAQTGKHGWCARTFLPYTRCCPQRGSCRAEHFHESLSGAKHCNRGKCR